MKKPATFQLENYFWDKGFNHVAGADEVGRGAWAGPVVAAAVIFPRRVVFPESLYDSKKLTPKARESLSKLIFRKALAVGIGLSRVSTINKKGIGPSTHNAFRSAIKKLSPTPDQILVDAFYIKRLNQKIQKPIIRGDEIIASISAASIVAKVYRDNLMKKISKRFPEYGLEKNKGYGTAYHQSAIRVHNFSSIHRTSFNLSYLIQ